MIHAKEAIHTAKKKKKAVPTTADERIHLWDLTGSGDEPVVVKTFDGEKDVVEWLASEPTPWSRSPASPKEVMADLNLTWKDGGAFVDLMERRVEWTRRWLFSRADGSVWNPLTREEEIERKRREREARRPTRMSWQAACFERIGWKFRPGEPIPYTGKRTRGFLACRTPRHYRVARLVSDPEEGAYVRKGAIPPDPRLTDPFEDTPKCWKDQSKRRKQAKAYDTKFGKRAAKEDGEEA